MLYLSIISYTVKHVCIDKTFYQYFFNFSPRWKALFVLLRLLCVFILGNSLLVHFLGKRFVAFIAD